MNSSLYNTFPIQVKKAKGCIIESTEGKKYLDTFSGIGVLLFGHSYEPIVRAMKEKMENYMHISNFFVDPDAEIVEKYLLEASNIQGEVYFCNSGTESTEAALRMVKKREHTTKNQILHFSRGYHGRTIGSLSILGNTKVKERFGSLLPNIQCLEWNNEDEFDLYMKENGTKLLSLFIEPIQGAGGIRIISEPMAEMINYYHKKYQFVLICDEIQSGLGRTGKWFAYQHWGMKPDIVLVGKGLGGGLPLGATIFSEKLWKNTQPGDHGSTFAPNPIAVAGARCLLQQIPACISHICETDLYLKNLLHDSLQSSFKGIRQKGFMIGIGPEIMKKDIRIVARERYKLLLNCTSDGTIRLLPPLNTTKEELNTMISLLKNSAEECIG